MYVCLFVSCPYFDIGQGRHFCLCTSTQNLTSPLVSFVCLTVLLVKSVINFDQEIR